VGSKSILDVDEAYIDNVSPPRLSEAESPVKLPRQILKHNSGNYASRMSLHSNLSVQSPVFSQKHAEDI
jgi:hypothetical protein